MKKNILITGGSGFIGKNIIEQLGKRYIIFSPSHSELDLQDREKVEEFFKTHYIDVVIHAANVGGNRKDQFVPNMLMTNLKNFFNLARCDKYFKKMIFLGSGAEYEKRFPIVNVKESDFGKNIPTDDYGLYKYICSEYIQNNSKVINLRLFGVFGKHEDYEIRFISQAICKNLFGLPITMQQNVFFDYVYIDDFVKILDYFIQYDTKEKFYNIGTGKPIDLLTIAKTVNKISGNKSKIIIKKKELNNEYTCDNSRLLKEIPNLRFTDFKNSVEELYSWYKSVKPSLSIESFLKDQ